MEEELLVRGICVYLLKDENNYIRYLVPNILFAAMHLFSYTNWGKITLVYVFSFITSQMLGLILTGCIFPVSERKIRHNLDSSAGSCDSGLYGCAGVLEYALYRESLKES